MSASEDTSFPRLVSLACHDLRTPLATVSGFAKTLTRVEGIDDKLARYLGLMETASEQLGELLEELNVAARIAGGRYDPVHRKVDTLELARAAAERVEGVQVTGSGASVEIDVDAVERALAAFASCLRRHGPVESVRVEVAGEELRPRAGDRGGRARRARGAASRPRVGGRAVRRRGARGLGRGR